MDERLRDDVAQGRFELAEGGHTVVADYRREPGLLVISYVAAPPELRGTGAAGRLMEGVLGLARAEARKVKPVCGYAGAYIRRHREHHDLLA
jgi:predicted GNAT family acetyltransferase